MIGFIKHYPSSLAAETAFQRASTAIRAGVRTPAVLNRIDPQSLLFERVEGRHPETPAILIQALPVLNRMPQTGLSRFDPFLRIRPRLTAAPPEAIDLAHHLMARDAEVNWQPTAVIHGDFHPGQVICDAQGQAWLIDLDDLALAPPEADLGNLAAWMATQGRPRTMPLGDHLAPEADPVLLRHFQDIALLRRGLKLAEKGQRSLLDRLTLRA